MPKLQYVPFTDVSRTSYIHGVSRGWIISWLLCLFAVSAQTNSLKFSTLNCYWFFQLGNILLSHKFPPLFVGAFLRLHLTGSTRQKFKINLPPTSTRGPTAPTP